MNCNSCLKSITDDHLQSHKRDCRHCYVEILICRPCMVGTMNDNYNLSIIVNTKYELKRLTCCRSCERDNKLKEIGIFYQLEEKTGFEPVTR